MAESKNFQYLSLIEAARSGFRFRRSSNLSWLQDDLWHEHDEVLNLSLEDVLATDWETEYLYLTNKIYEFSDRRSNLVCKKQKTEQTV